MFYYKLTVLSISIAFFIKREPSYKDSLFHYEAYNLYGPLTPIRFNRFLYISHYAFKIQIFRPGAV